MSEQDNINNSGQVPSTHDNEPAVRSGLGDLAEKAKAEASDSSLVGDIKNDTPYSRDLSALQTEMASDRFIDRDNDLKDLESNATSPILDPNAKFNMKVEITGKMPEGSPPIFEPGEKMDFEDKKVEIKDSSSDDKTSPDNGTPASGLSGLANKAANISEQSTEPTSPIPAEVNEPITPKQPPADFDDEHPAPDSAPDNIDANETEQAAEQALESIPEEIQPPQQPQVPIGTPVKMSDSTGNISDIASGKDEPSPHNTPASDSDSNDNAKTAEPNETDNDTDSEKDESSSQASEDAPKSNLETLSDKANVSSSGTGEKSNGVEKAALAAKKASDVADGIKTASKAVGTAAKIAKHIPVAAPVATAVEAGAKVVEKNAGAIANGAQKAADAAGQVADAVPKPSKASVPLGGGLSNEDSDGKTPEQKKKERRRRKMAIRLVIKLMPIIAGLISLVIVISACGSLCSGGLGSKNATIEQSTGTYIPTVNIHKGEEEEDETKNPWNGEWIYYDQSNPNSETAGWDTSSDGPGIHWGSGCGVVSFAMACSSYAGDPTYNPSYLAANNISSGSAISEGNFVNFINSNQDKIHLKAESANKDNLSAGWKDNWDKVKSICNNGGCVLIGGNVPLASGYPYYSHYVIVRTVSDGKVSFANPAGGIEEEWSESNFKALDYLGDGGHTTTIYMEYLGGSPLIDGGGAASKAQVKNFKTLNQKSLGYDNGCEIAALTQTLNYYKISCTIDQVCEALPKTPENKSIYDSNPNEEYIGNPKTGQTGIGCYEQPLKKAGAAIARGRGYHISASNGDKSLSDLCSQYIDKGQPVVVWGTIDNETSRKEGRYGGVDWIRREHCMTLVGYDNSNVFIADPLKGQIVSYNKSKFEENYNALGKRSLRISK